jgi:hypothetical protein
MLILILRPQRRLCTQTASLRLLSCCDGSPSENADVWAKEVADHACDEHFLVSFLLFLKHGETTVVFSEMMNRFTHSIVWYE